MKRIIPFFVVCLGLSAFATDSVFALETSRGAQKRDSSNVVGTNATSRTKATDKQKTSQNRTESARTTVKPRTNVQNRATNTTQRQTVKPRSTTTTNQKTTRTPTVSSRGATKSEPIKRVTATRPAVSSKNISRAASRPTELNETKISDIRSKDYSKCKSVYYEWMDEFCANKDANLGRCACSSRIHEFDSIKKQLSNAEDKMLDFNQRLLLVGLEKEDAAAVNVASEGELGYQTKDSTKSEKLLQKITKNLNSSSDSKIDNNMSAISLTLDMDSAWDSVDSLSGISTTAKNGLELYNAARPVCVEMAHEVCSEEELTIAQDSYKLFIQQDCNTVAKSYDTQYNQAMQKINESSALLDMARLNSYQQRNSDDILTCKKKILEQMYDSSVCGSDLHKCLDITGQYINPADGTAFLTTNLYNITTLLTAPVGTESWSKLKQNEKFVTFLNSKKKFLEPAIEQCEQISDMVWKDFLDDALGQIKLAQNAKLEEIRQSCTTLVAECKTESQQSLEDFDARALSTFQVIADSTVNALCRDVEDSCVNLLNASGGGATEWETGMTGVAADMSYESIIETCTTVGKDCIIQQCNGASGNFALCSDFSTTPRRAILNRQACWREVLACVNQSTNLSNVTADITKSGRRQYYKNTYFGDETDDTTFTTIMSHTPTFCSSEADIACMITEQIWGNCENNPSTTPLTTNSELIAAHPNDLFAENKILIPKEDSSLLSWFASNTGTTDSIDSCSTYNCPINYKYDEDLNICKQMVPNDSSLTTSDGTSIITTDEQIYITNTLTNYCAGGKSSKDMYGNCCASRKTSNGICVPDSSYTAVFLQNAYCNVSIELKDAPNYYCPENTTVIVEVGEGQEPASYYQITNNKKLSLYCIEQSLDLTATNGTFNCDGYLVLIDQYGNYIKPGGISAGPTMSYKSNGATCTYRYSGGSWSFGCGDISDIVPKDNQFTISY